MNSSAGRWAASTAVAVATALLLLGVGVAALFNPPFVAFEQGRADSAGWTGFSQIELRSATDAILGELYFGPGDFAVTVGGQPVLDARERSHMRDVRVVFAGFFGLVGVSALLLLLVGWRTRGRSWVWRAMRRGAIGLAVGVVALGAVAVVAFDALFEAFHEIFFAGGSYLFDPRTERLVQLFPDQFWFETSIALAGILLLFAAAVALIAGRRSNTDPAIRSAVVMAAPEAPRP